ncbi:MAG TPA: tetratricopeptide repeat protein [Frankiaceae bacterium]|jgi:tetratricopeptide (TPR) repeat protein|nr:tetratricopeptide repeat protein [Frankiaceae bacterium]
MRKTGWRTVALMMALLVALTGCGKDKPKAKKVEDELQRGLNAHVAGDTNGAIQHYEEVLKIDPTNKFAIYNIGLIKQNAGDKGEAERRYRAVLTIDPNYGPALFNLGIIRFEAGSNDEAIQLYQRTIAVEPRNANAYLNLGFAYKAGGKQREADQAFATAVRLDPSLRARIPARTASPSPTPHTTVSPTP